MSWFKRKNIDPIVKPSIFELGGGWGNSIQIMGSDWTKGHVYGFKTSRPRVGDELNMAMQSGRVIHGVFWKVERKTDPSDMFFGEIKWQQVTEDGETRDLEPSELEPVDA